MKNIKAATVGKRVWILTGTLLVCVLTVGFISIFNLQVLIGRLQEETNVELPAVRNMTLVDMMHDGIRANVLQAVVASKTKNTSQYKEVRQEYEEFSSNIRQYLGELEKLPLDQDIKKSIQDAKPGIESYIAVAGKVKNLALGGQTDLAIASLPQFSEKFEELEKSLEKLGSKIESLAKEAGNKASKTATRSKMIAFAVMAISLVLGFLTSLFLIRGLKKNLVTMTLSLNSESKGVSQSASVLSQAANELTESATKQASALQETASSLEEITAMVKKTSENSELLNKTAQNSHESASKGEQNTTQMLGAIETIAVSNAEMVKQISESNQKVSDIVKVIAEIGNKTKVINDIVFQTKLLSFNASVEAARAGEHGKGFAVVAEEVGNLAQMSGSAAKEIAELLESSIRTVNQIVSESKSKVESLMEDGKSKIELGKDVSRKCKESLNEIVSQSSEVSRLITEITTAIQEQNQGIQEISKALSLLDQNAHQNTATSQKTSKTAIDLLARSKTLLSVVGDLRSLAMGEREDQSAIADPLPNNVVEIKKERSAQVDSKGTTQSSYQPEKKAVGQNILPKSDDPRFEDI